MLPEQKDGVGGVIVEPPESGGFATRFTVPCVLQPFAVAVTVNSVVEGTLLATGLLMLGSFKSPAGLQE